MDVRLGLIKAALVAASLAVMALGVGLARSSLRFKLWHGGVLFLVALLLLLGLGREGVPEDVRTWGSAFAVLLGAFSAAVLYAAWRGR